MYGVNIEYDNKKRINSYLALKYFKDYAFEKKEEFLLNESNITLYHLGNIKKLLNNSIRAVYSEGLEKLYGKEIYKSKKVKECISKITEIVIYLKKLENSKNKIDYIKIYDNNIKKLEKEKFFEKIDIEIKKILEFLGTKEISFLKSTDYNKFIIEENQYFDADLMTRLEKNRLSVLEKKKRFKKFEESLLKEKFIDKEDIIEENSKEKLMKEKAITERKDKIRTLRKLNTFEDVLEYEKEINKNEKSIYRKFLGELLFKSRNKEEFEYALSKVKMSGIKFKDRDNKIFKDIKNAKGFYNALKKVELMYLKNENVNIEIYSALLGKVETEEEYKFVKNQIEFRFNKIPEEYNGDLLKIKEVPDKIVFLEDMKEINLLEVIISDDKYKIYDTDSYYFAKVFNDECLTKYDKEKISTMLEKKIYYKGICWPKKLIYNKYGEFIGYLTNKFNGKSIDDIDFKKMECLNDLGIYQKGDLIKLCITIANRIEYLNGRNVLLGDNISSNIKVVSPSEVHLINTDTYQVENYCCLEINDEFSSKEKLIKRYKEKNLEESNYLRSFEEEYFSLSILIFKILLSGKHPYSQESHDIIENIINMNFIYNQENLSYEVDEYSLIWNHLLDDIKIKFIETFNKDGQYSEPENRIRPIDWIWYLTRYLKVKPSLMKKDRMSLSIFPTRYKRNYLKYTYRDNPNKL